MGEIRVAIECGGCGRIVLIPAAWHVIEYLCVRCRALGAPEPDPPEAA